ncbi:MAG: hypothetical protein K2P81_17475 [Bacteriovoracaceae bacterium]|nr:hypothetical protein [Bacteriovoracaceae bacterium]
MIKPIKIQNIFLARGDKLILMPGHRIQRVVRQMIKHSRLTHSPKKKRSSH